MSDSNGLVALIGEAHHSWTMVNALRRHLGDFPVVVEQGEPASVFWARRRKKLGQLTVLSMQAAERAARLVKPFTRRRRLAELLALCDITPVSGPSRVEIVSANDSAAIETIRALRPKAVFVASTGLLRRPLLEGVPCPFVNYHSGVNPAYRGINGGYFALARGEPENFGVTLHLVDTGVDTGSILATNRIETTKDDSLLTYMTLMAARSQELVVETMVRVLEGDLTPAPPSNLPSAQYYAPTLGQYLANGILRHVW